MKQRDFNNLSPELQKEYLERGGTVEPNFTRPRDPFMTWNYKSMYGKQAKPKTKKKRRQK